MSRARRKNKKKQDVQGKLFFIVGILILGILGFTFYQEKSNEVIRDKVSLCREDGVITTENVILIDATDSFNSTQALMVKKEFKFILDNSEIDSRFSLYVINTNISDEKPLLEICNPGDGGDKSELTSNKRRLLKTWQENFYEKMITQVDFLIDVNVADSSPIMETIKYASVNSFYNSVAKNKKLILVSDLLQHTKNYSNYKESISYDTFSSRSIANSLTPSLNDVEIEILYLYRAKDANKQNRKHIAFWEQYFSEVGAVVTRVKKVN
jgi:hypothetical protein